MNKEQLYRTESGSFFALATMASDAERPQKKRKLARKKSNRIHCLPDESLLEILCRLPCSKSAIQCKSVCKRWASLISCPFFIGLFTADKKRKQLQLFCTLLRAYPSRGKKDTWSGLTMYLRDPVFKLKKLSFSSLPTFKDGNATAFTMHASCNDLFVYCKDELGKQYYYICNVRTEQWLLLPSFPFYYRTFVVAFICDPYYMYDHEQKDGAISSNNVVLNPAYRYSIVVLPYECHKRSMMRAHLFSNYKNGTSEWREIVLSLPQPCRLVGKNSGFVFDGKLHFVCFEGIICFDPYDVDGNKSGVFKCHIIAWPYVMSLGGQRIGECRGRLLLCFYADTTLLVWCLKDYEMSEWSLEHSIAMQDWIIRNECVSSYVKRDSRLGLLCGQLLAIHPTNPDVVYLLFPRWIVLCKLSARTVEIASRIDAVGAGLIPSFFPFQSMLPSWPTPLPTLN